MEDEQDKAGQELSPESQDLSGTQDSDAQQVKTQPDSCPALVKPESQPEAQSSTEEAGLKRQSSGGGTSACNYLSLQFTNYYCVNYASFCSGCPMVAAILCRFELGVFLTHSEISPRMQAVVKQQTIGYPLKTKHPQFAKKHHHMSTQIEKWNRLSMCTLLV